MSSQLLSNVRRAALAGTTGLTGFATFKANTDPIHLFWDLDHTILCSISPLPDGGAPARPNTRTYFRPGARAALQICSYIGILHVYTAAQESYTNNILKQLDPDRRLFDKVIHRDDYPATVKEGKDLTVGTDRMDRAILFDDKVSNFQPQQFENGISVLPYTSERVDGHSWTGYLIDIAEMARLVGISFWGSIHLSGDARKVVSYWRSDK
eukprot:g7054.t1 g7054   contig23:1760911-1761789(-)